jgi:hypothetical protein
VVEITEKVPKCQFCGFLIGEGFKHHELYICVECWTLLTAIIEDSLPMILHEVSKKAEKAIQKVILRLLINHNKITKIDNKDVLNEFTVKIVFIISFQNEPCFFEIVLLIYYCL